MLRNDVITFEPLLKQTIWGGDRIKEMKGFDTELDHVGESWEVSGVEGSVSVIANGEYRGRRLDDVVAELKGRLVGRDNYERFGDEFPLLVKFIDAHSDLSIQVHPTDEQARQKGLKRGKTEMWFVMDSEAGARLRCGLKSPLTPEQYKAMVDNDTICDAISDYDVKEGDCFFIPAGRIHSIGAGCLLAEIQETSDVTYRIYDFKRKDKNGNYRQLHTKEAAESIDYGVKDSYRTEYVHAKDEGVQLISCEHFTTALYDLTEPMELDYSELDSFVILVCTKGDGTIVDDDGNRTAFATGTVVLLPAWVGNVRVEGKVKFLETYV